MSILAWNDNFAEQVTMVLVLDASGALQEYYRQ